MTRPRGETITVAEEADVVLAGRRAKAVLADLGVEEATVDEIVLVVHELVSNIVKHAGEGSITLLPATVDGEEAIQIRADDTGPGITDVDLAVVDGYSTVGSLGGGLGSVHRFMDDVVINSKNHSGSGVEIVATRWMDGTPSDQRTPPLAVAAVTRPKPGYDQNGDAFLIEHGPGQTLVGVIDGLGHGAAAHRASNVAKQYVQTHPTLPLGELFDGVNRVCADTRGVVMQLARFDWEASTFTLGSVGNIATRVCDSPESLHLVPRRGVLGGRASRPEIEDWDWDPASTMVVHSDGISSKWQCDELSLDTDRSVADTATEMLRKHWNRTDDATVLVVRGVDR